MRNNDLAYSISEIGRARSSSETLLDRFFSSEHAWLRVLEKFDLAKGDDGLLEGWRKEDLAQVLALVAKAAIHKQVAVMKSGDMYLHNFSSIRKRLTTEGRTPEQFGTSLREIARFEKKAVDKEVRDKLESIDGSGAIPWSAWETYPRIELIKFLAERKRKLSEFVDVHAFWAKFEAECNTTLKPESLAKRLRGKGKNGKAQLICDIIAFHRAGYITLDPHFDLDALEAQAKRLGKYVEVAKLPKV